MPSLIGSAPNQVPTNGMLGTMAFQDADNASVATKAVTDNSTSLASTAFVKSVIDTRNEILTTTGTGSAYSITPSIPISQYTAGQVFNLVIHVDSLANPTLSVSGLASKSLYALVENNVYVALKAGTLQSWLRCSVMYDGLSFIVISPIRSTSLQSKDATDNIALLTPVQLRYALNASGSAPIYACRAWVNFNGTGTVAIRASGNVTSITDNGVGDYTVNFTTAMEDANYAVTTSGHASESTSAAGRVTEAYSYTVSSVKIVTGASSSGGVTDNAIVNVCIFR